MNSSKIATQLILLLSLLMLNIFPSKALAIDCNSVFPGPVQSFDASGSFYMQSGARIESYLATELCFAREDDNNRWETSSESCGGGRCVVTGTPSVQRAPIDVWTSRDNTYYQIPNWPNQAIRLGESLLYGRVRDATTWDVGNINIYDYTLTFSDIYSNYIIKGLTATNSSRVILTAGKTYYIDGNLTLNGNSKIEVVGSGITKLYIAGNFTSDNYSTLLWDNSLDVFVGGDLVVRGNSQLQGSFYVKQQVTLQNDVRLWGQVSGKNVSMLGNAKVIYGGGVPEIPFCDEIFTQPPSGNHQPGLTPPSNIGPLLGDIRCDGVLFLDICSGINNFLPGDYNFHNGYYSNFLLGQDNFVFTSGLTTRLYFDNLSLDGVTLNPSRAAENLIIYVRNSLSVTSNVNVNGIIYLAQGATLIYHGTLLTRPYLNINGAIAAGGGLTLQNGSIRVLPNAVNNADFNGMCRKRPQPVVIDHFEIEINNSPLTCTPLSMTLKACKNASCSELYTDPVTATLAPEAGPWLPNNPVSFSGGSTTIQLSHTQAGPVTLDVTGSAPVTKAFSTTLCRQNGGALSNAACTVNFSDSGFVFDVPDKLAAKPIDVLIKAVKKDDITKRCVSAFASTPKNLKFWSSVVDRPSIAGYTPPPVTVDSRAIATAAASASAQVVQFNAQGEASVKVNYDDAGKLALHAQYIGSGIDAGLVMEGNDAFVSFPVGLCVTAPEPNADCASGSASCSAFRAAGDPFTLNIRAKRWQNDNDSNICSNGDTPSFAMNAVALSHQLVAPQNGQLGELAQRDYAQLASVSGTNVQQSVSEVGVFQFGASVQSPYLGSQAFTIPAYLSDPVGRFYPAGFIAENTSLTPGCGAFTYMDQPFFLSTNLRALNRGGQLTQNYTGIFADGVARLQAANNLDGIDLSARLSALAGQWNNGQMSFSQAPVTFSRPPAPQADGPYSALALGVRIDDRDLVPMANADMRADAVGSCTSSCNAQRLSTLDVRQGRAVLANTYGPENQAIMMAGASQYWDGQQWRLNTDDSCSVVDGQMLSLVSNNNMGYAFEPEMHTPQGITRSAAPAAVNQGEFGIRWQSSGTYRGKVTAPIVVPDYLEWYWNYDTQSNQLEPPRGSVYFGRYRGNDRIINWRELP